MIMNEKSVYFSEAVEIALLGTLMHPKDNYHIEVLRYVTETDFYYKHNSDIYRIVKYMYKEYKTFDLSFIETTYQTLVTKDYIKDITLSRILELVAHYMAEFTTSENTILHINILLEYASKRELRRLGQYLNTKLDNGHEYFQMTDKIQHTLATLSERIQTLKSPTNDKQSAQLKEMYQKVLSGEVNRVPTGFDKWDELLNGGFRKGDIIYIAARPSVGKTAMMCTLATKQAFQQKIPVKIYSLEMEATQLITRVAAIKTGINSRLIENGQLTIEERQKYFKFLDTFNNTPLIIDDKPFTITQLVQDIRLEVARKGIQIVYIDYISFIKEPNLKEINAQNRNQLLGYITKELKRLAKEVQIPIVILGQLNRSIEQGGASDGKINQREPELSDIRDSGEIEQDLDIAMFIVRPSQGGFETFVDGRPAIRKIKTDEGYKSMSMADIVMKKNRNGEIGRVQFAYIKERTLFQEHKDDESELDGSEVSL